MAPLIDSKYLLQFREALRERRVDGFIVWKKRPALWLRENLSGVTELSVTSAMHEHIEAGFEIDQVPERREHHRDRHEYHFDFRLTIERRSVYIETTPDDSRTGPTITIVSMHDV